MLLIPVTHVTVIVVLTCCCVPNFIEIGLRVRSPNAHNCRMFNAPYGHCHGNRNMADMSKTWWDVTTKVASQSVPFYASYGISNIFQHGGRRPFWIIKTVIFDHLTVTVVLKYCCVPTFIKIVSCVRSPDAHNCKMFNAPHGRCHGNRNTADTSRTWWDAITQVAFQSVHW